jgi:SAM-dependent methyltransferase
MNQDDLDFLARCLKKGLIKSPCLEVGVSEDHNTRLLLEAQGIKYFGADLSAGTAVDFQVDIGQPFEVVREVFKGQTFKTALVLNLLEHTFEPIKVLDNIFALLDPEGSCVITTPVVWPLHDYPVDCWRINPNFYEQYCKSRSLRLFYDMFEYLKYGPVRNGDDSYTLPAPARGWRHFYSRAVHKLFNTSGRGMTFPSHISLGVVIRKSKENSNAERT